MDNVKAANEVVAQTIKKKPGRKPMTAEEKAAKAKTRAESKAKADQLKPTFIIQFQGTNVDLSTLVDAAKADFRQTKKRAPITDMKLYVKPEDRMAYYVINGTNDGSVSF